MIRIRNTAFSIKNTVPFDFFTSPILSFPGLQFLLTYFLFHQIRSALKWDRWMALMGIKTADGKQNFKTCLHFLNFKVGSPSGILLPLSALHAIRRFRMQFALQVIWLPLAKALKESEILLQVSGRNLTTACNTLLFSRIFWILHAVANSFWQDAKRNFMSFCRILSTLCSQIVFHNVPHFSLRRQKSETKSTA